VSVPSPNDLFDLTGKVAVITGGSRGLGREMGLAFAERGAKVVVSSRKQDACDATAAEIAEATGRIPTCAPSLSPVKVARMRPATM
jgi:NAD(P)-dependent dehydrogenase (short-subunit alcohol dehydrogenase family)